MAQAKFNLRSRKTEKETPIYMKFYYKSKLPFTYPTEIKTYVKKWDFDKQRIVGYSAETKLYNKHLDFLAISINMAFLELRQSGKSFTLKSIETEFYKKIGISKITYTVSEYAEKLDADKEKIGKKSYLKPIIYQLNKFNKKIGFDEITHDFYVAFTEHIFNQNLKRSYVNQLFSLLKIVCNAAIEEEITQNTAHKKFKRMKEEVEMIHISTKRIGELYHFKDLSENEEKARDAFVLGCCVGLRHSDWHKIKMDNIKELKGNKILSITDQKKGNYLAVPLTIFPYAIPILEKYNYKMPKFRNDTLNDIIQRVTERVGWIEPIQKAVYRKNVTVETFRFCDLVATHTARRSFVTNLKTRYSDSEIMKMTGHKSTRSFAKYDRQTAEDNAVEIANKFNKLKIAK
jgi:integrase